MTIKNLQNQKVIKCACGCGQKLEKYDNQGRPRKYLWGHNNMWKPLTKR